MARNTVGKSGVTPTKHFLLDRLLGQEAGVYGTGRLPWCDKAVWVDLTAGDGEPTNPQQPEKSCSAGIFTKHASFVSTNKKPLEVALFEINTNTHSRLKLNLETVWFRKYPEAQNVIQTFNENSALLTLNECDEAACFLYNDPNSIDDWAFTPDLLKSAPPFTRTLTTMGCNVGGLKRVLSDSPERSDKWRENIEMLFMLQKYELVLLAVGDASQWAYLITTPDKWLNKTVELCKKAHNFQTKTKREPRVITTKEPKEFDLLLDELLMTKEQLLQKNLIQQELTL